MAPNIAMHLCRRRMEAINSSVFLRPGDGGRWANLLLRKHRTGFSNSTLLQAIPKQLACQPAHHTLRRISDEWQQA